LIARQLTSGIYEIIHECSISFDLWPIDLLLKNCKH